uniref:Uncharacterized protein n=1 Tax=Aegilops tauschii subsp. strangulata TaxID=200361 RepID=A0A453L4D1_AEGTS
LCCLFRRHLPHFCLVWQKRKNLNGVLIMAFLGARIMGLLELFITACMPVLNMLLVTGVGSFLATDSVGILGKEARKHLNYVSAASDSHLTTNRFRKLCVFYHVPVIFGLFYFFLRKIFRLFY